MFDGDPLNTSELSLVYAIEGDTLHPYRVSPADVVWASQWRWKVKRSKEGKKIYACRNFRVGGRGGRCVTVWLHKEVCYRMLGRPPSKLHIMVDHIDGDHFNCTRENLRWATPSMNRQNYHGFFSHQLRMAFLTNDDKRLEKFQ